MNIALLIAIYSVGVLSFIGFLAASFVFLGYALKQSTVDPAEHH